LDGSGKSGNGAAKIRKRKERRRAENEWKMRYLHPRSGTKVSS